MVVTLELYNMDHKLIHVQTVNQLLPIIKQDLHYMDRDGFFYTTFDLVLYGYQTKEEPEATCYWGDEIVYSNVEEYENA